MTKGSLLGSIDQICLHSIGNKLVMADVHEVSEMPADSGVPNVHWFR